MEYKTKLYTEGNNSENDKDSSMNAITQDKDEKEKVIIFQDMENCPVPKRMITINFVHKMRENLYYNNSKDVKLLASKNNQN